MAKVKKKEALSIEEKLERALVPVDEQPYEVPENWCWVYLGALLSEIKNGTTIKQDKSGEGYGVTRIESLQNQTVDFNRLGTIVDSNAIKETDWYQAGDIAMSHINSAEHVGKTAMITEDMLPLVHGMNLLRLRFYECCLPKYFQYFTQSYQYKDEILKRINMAVNQVSINQKQVGTLEFPMPPIAEQQRVVEQIGSLFAKLDEAKEKAENVLEFFDKRKAALYNMAFSGELTEQWRRNNGIEKDTWISTTMGDISCLITKGASPRWQGVEYTDDKTQTLFVTSENVREGYLDLSKEKYLDNKINEIQKRSVLHYGDVLVNIVGASIGRAAIYNLEKLANTNQAVCIVRLKDMEINDFVCFYLNSPTAQQYYCDNKVETARANISLANISSMPIMIPAEPERREIMDKLKYLFEKEDASKEMLSNLIDNIELMKKSILAKAFRGELGTNNPNEESAVELLKQIIL